MKIHNVLRPCSLLALALCAAPALGQASLALRRGDLQTDVVVTNGARSLAVHSTAAAVTDARLHVVPGSAAMSATWTETDVRGAVSAWYSISLDGESFHQPRRTSYDLKLRFGEFDPSNVAPAVGNLAAPRGSELYIVQYWTQGIEAYRSALRARGAVLHLFLPHHAQVVRMTPAQAEEVAALSFVRWIGPFHTAYKLEQGLLSPTNPIWLEADAARVNILTMERGTQGQGPVATLIRSIGGSVDATSPETYRMVATLTRGQLLLVAQMDEVQWIDVWGAPENDMNIARNMHGSNYIESVAGYLGDGVHVEVLDGGCTTTHPDLQNFVLHGPNTAGSHGSSTSGINCGTGVGNFNARGAMPEALLIIADYAFLSGSTNPGGSGGARYAHTAQLQTAQYECVLQSNSFGAPRTFNYSAVSQEMDLILFDFDRISILQSQSNAGNQDSRPQAWAKNIIAVGGIRHMNTETKIDDTWNFGASIGPAADGRIKPDLASYYDNILTTSSGTGYTSGFGGTSGATPIIAGHLGLFYQMWSDGIFGNPTPGANVYENRPFNTTAKAVLINTATQWNFTGANADLTRVHQGWGHADLKTMYDKRAEILVINETDVLTELQSISYPTVVVPNTPEFKATLVYRDPPGTTSASQHRINDLDLKVTAPNGDVYWGNNGLLAANYSSVGGNPNTIDTVENVFVENPAVGLWQVEVIASDVNQDSHVETPAVDVDFALVVSGIDPSGSFLGFNYCDAAPNSTGVSSAISATGSKQVALNDLTLEASNMPQNQFGYFLTSQTQGVVMNPGGSSGNLCIVGNIGRFNQMVQNSGASGSFSLVVDLTNVPTNPPAAVQPGESWYYQVWHRDVVLGFPTSNFTNGYCITFE